jgi:hypothetical protein
LQQLQRHQPSIEKLKAVYLDHYKATLLDDIEGDFSGRRNRLQRFE